MTYGYSSRITKLNKAADKRRLGVALGRCAIEQGVAVSDIASTLGVSRQTVYNWFIGTYDPQAQHIDQIKSLLAWLQQASK